MASIADFFPLFNADEESIYAEMAARANVGVGVDDPDYVDTRVGSIFYLSSYPAAVGIAAAYGRMNEAAAAGIVATSWDAYLDLHAESYGTERKAGTSAEGLLTFQGNPGALVPSGARALPPQTDPDIDPPIFETTASGTVLADEVQTIQHTATGGSFALTFSGQTTAAIAWNDPAATVQARLEALSNLDPGDVVVTGGPLGAATLVRFVGTRRASDQPLMTVASNSLTGGGGSASLSVTTTTVGGGLSGAAGQGSVTLAARALEPGTGGNVGAGKITQMDSGVSGVASVVNLTAMSGGAEVESDPALKKRLAQRFEGGQGANVAWYEARALEEPGVGRVTVVANWNGDGTVLVILMDEDGRNVSQSVVDSLQIRLDPVPGQGAGQAPIDHEVTVRTPTVLLVNARSTPIFKPGYSLDGAGGTIGIRNELAQAASAYIDSLSAGDDVIYNAVEASYFAVEGLLNVTGLQIQFDGGSWVTTDLAVGTNPAQVAASKDITFV